MKTIDVIGNPAAGIDEAVAALRRGGVIVYPTDTLYGFGVDARNGQAVRRLREINVLLFDFALKRSLSLNGQGFKPSVFETAPFFGRPA